NISEFLDETITMDEFKQLLLRYIFSVDDVEQVPRYELTDEDWENIYRLSNERYRKWEWNFGQSPSFNIRESHKFDSGLLDVRLDVKKGIIENCKIYGDFFGIGDVSVLEKQLTGVRHERKSLEKALEDIEVPHYLGKITKEQLINLIY